MTRNAITSSRIPRRRPVRQRDERFPARGRANAAMAQATSRYARQALALRREASAPERTDRLCTGASSILHALREPPDPATSAAETAALQRQSLSPTGSSER
jgi:hypothetical protein